VTGKAQWAPFSRRIGARLAALALLALALCACAAQKTADIYANLDLGSGGSGFAAIMYAQEVTSGVTFRGHYASGSHGLVVLPTSEPVHITVDAPGTYVFYAVLVEAPDDYHYGATGCQIGADCSSSPLIALDVAPGQSYHVTISDRHAILPTPGAPVSVPWERPTPSK
jgi:hypothetical protein